MELNFKIVLYKTSLQYGKAILLKVATSKLHNWLQSNVQLTTCILQF